MGRGVYRFVFAKGVPLESVFDSLTLSVLAAEGLHGHEAVQLDTHFSWDQEKGECAIDIRTKVGMDISKIFTGLLTREFGEEAFLVLIESSETVLATPIEALFSERDV